MSVGIVSRLRGLAVSSWESMLAVGYGNGTGRSGRRSEPRAIAEVRLDLFNDLSCCFILQVSQGSSRRFQQEEAIIYIATSQFEITRSTSSSFLLLPRESRLLSGCSEEESVWLKSGKERRRVIVNSADWAKENKERGEDEPFEPSAHAHPDIMKNTTLHRKDDSL
jgi:hypothetical protein